MSHPALAASILEGISPKERGIECFNRSEWAPALAAFDEALVGGLADAQLHNYRARVLDAMGRPADALQAIERALELQPHNPADLRNRGLLLRKLGRPAEALASFESVLAVRPDDLDLGVKRAHLLNEPDRREEALLCAERLVSIHPQALDALNALGMVLENLGRYLEAQSVFEQILKREPNSLDGINNQGLALARQGHWREALGCYERSLALQSDQPQARYNRSIVKLALGDWRSGLEEFECRWLAAPLKGTKLPLPTPLWLGEQAIEGRTLFVYHEQGYGDTLQCARYIPRLIERGARVIMAVPPALVRLMRTLPGNPTVIPFGASVPAHDFHCPLMSLLLAFRTIPDSIPRDVAYLRPVLEDALSWRQRLGTSQGLRIGIAWSGRRYAPINYPRDLALAQLKSLFELPAQFVSLQKDMSEEDRVLAQGLPFLDMRAAGELQDFADTAALISELDLVISVDSAVAHLAGALGKPVWLLNRYASCWRWGQSGETTAWYPSMRIFRQLQVGEWTDVIGRVRSSVDSVTQKTSLGEVLPTAPYGPSRRPKPRRSPETVRVVTATRGSQEAFFTQSALGRSLSAYRGYPRGQRLELRLFADNQKGLPTVYNRAIEEARESPAILVFMHDDVYLTDCNWTERLLDGLDEFGIVGIAGTRRRVPRQPSWMFLDEAMKKPDREFLSGVVGHGKGFPNLQQLSVYGEPGQTVKLLDGVLLAARSQMLLATKLKFDPRFDFHFYDLDFCRQAELRSVRMGTVAVSAVHESGGCLGSEQWRTAYAAYLKKYEYT